MKPRDEPVIANPSKAPMIPSGTSTTSLRQVEICQVIDHIMRLSLFKLPLLGAKPTTLLSRMAKWGLKRTEPEPA
jgi:hypothetical protein